VFIPATKRGDAWFVEPAGRSNIPLYLFGAGHVGRAVVANLAALSFDVTWVDTGAGRFPDGLKKTAALTPVVAPDPTVIARAAPEGAFHLVMTYSHPLDLAICHEVLAQGTFAYLGLIGSATKRARFLKRLRELGHDEALLRRLVCPIGVPGVIGKEPAVIAISVAAQLLEKAAFLRSAHVAPGLKGAAP
jgi:xanthine dehydrogenase accessory factor